MRPMANAGNEDVAADVDGAADDGLELRATSPCVRRCIAIAVRRLEDGQVDGAVGGGPGSGVVAEDRAVGAAEIAGEDDAAPVGEDLDARAAEDVARFAEGDAAAEVGDVRGEVVVREGRDCGVEGGEEAAAVGGGAVVEAHAVVEDEAGDRQGRRGGEDRAGEAAIEEGWEAADVIVVGVREDDGVDVVGGVGDAPAVGVVALGDAAVDEDASAGEVEAGHGAGHGVDGAEQGHLAAGQQVSAAPARTDAGAVTGRSRHTAV